MPTEVVRYFLCSKLLVLRFSVILSFSSFQTCRSCFSYLSDILTSSVIRSTGGALLRKQIHSYMFFFSQVCKYLRQFSSAYFILLIPCLLVIPLYSIRFYFSWTSYNLYFNVLFSTKNSQLTKIHFFLFFYLYIFLNPLFCLNIDLLYVQRRMFSVLFTS